MTKFIAVIAAKAEDKEADMVAVAVAMTTVAVEDGQPLRSSPPSLPGVFGSIAECEDNDRKTSIIMADTRDEGIVSPSQAG